MSRIIVGFSYVPDGWFSKLIRWVTKSQVSHAFVLLPYDDCLVFQASGLKLNYQGYSDFLRKEVVVEMYSFSLTDDQAVVNAYFRSKHAGDKYAWQEIIGFGWVLLMRLLGRRVRNPFSGGEHAHECVDTAAAQIPFEGKLGVEADQGTFTPEDLRRFCAQHGTLVKIK